MSDDNKTIQSEIGDVVGVDLSGDVVQKSKDKAKSKAQKMLDGVMFWKKEKTPEEKQADVQKKYEKIEKKYQKALDKAVFAETEGEKKLAEEKALQKKNKALKELQEKYPEEWVAISNAQKDKEQKDEQSDLTGSSATGEAEAEAPAKKKKTFWQKITAWTRKKTPEERQEACEAKLEKAKKKRDKALAKADKAETEEEKEAKIRKAHENYNKKCQKIEKKYPEEVKKVKEAEAKEIADRNARIKQAADAEISARNEAIRKAEEAKKRFDNLVTINEVKTNVLTPTEERKLATLKKWMREVHLPEENAQKMIDKYGIDMAYRVTQRCMLEPDILMPEIDSSFKKIQNKSSKSIQYFLNLDTENADNKAKVSKVTNLPFIEKSGASGKEEQGAATSTVTVANDVER